ncbi:MAG: hypothetical protein H6644_02715 [Caldilineaceae bacterium]|nr:hypothetical protein [Caldilineaceae bacterium]
MAGTRKGLAPCAVNVSRVARTTGWMQPIPRLPTPTATVMPVCSRAGSGLASRAARVWA